jgi:hypothetical protein
VTITSNQVSQSIDEHGVDQRPGSSDVTWAERAYNQQRESANEPRVSRPRRHRLRILVATLALVCLMAGLIIAMRAQGASPSPVVTQPTSSQAATAPQPTTVLSPFKLWPQLINPSPSLSPFLTINSSKR